MVAMEIEKLGFPAVYISGAVLAADLGLPDIGLTTLNEVAERGKQIARVTNLPCIIDADTGFGEPMNVARTVLMFEEAGLAGLHLEDQMNPKRCGHLDNKKLCSKEEMVQKIQTAVKSKRDKNFLIIARTDARAVEGMDKTLERIRIYEDAGAEMIFPEAMQNEKEFEQVRKVTSLPLLANMTEFGKSELLDKNQLENLGYQMVLSSDYLAIGYRFGCSRFERNQRKRTPKRFIKKIANCRKGCMILKNTMILIRIYFTLKSKFP